MEKIKKMIKEKGVKILLLGGALKLAILIFIIQKGIIISFDLIFSIAVFLALLGVAGHYLIKTQPTFKKLFIIGAAAMAVYNLGIGFFGLGPVMPLNIVLMSSFDMGIAAIVAGYIMGVRR